MNARCPWSPPDETSDASTAAPTPRGQEVTQAMPY